MSYKNEILKIGLLTALVAFGTIGVCAVVLVPGIGIISPAHALRSTGGYCCSWPCRDCYCCA